MRPERDIETVLDAWMASGPTTMPDRIYEGVLDRIERVPQRRSAWPTTRLPRMFTILKVPAAALAAALIIGLVTIPLFQASDDVGQAPALSGSPSPSQPTLPESMMGNWSGPPRAVEGLSLLEAFATWRVTRSAFAVDLWETAGTDLLSHATVIGPDRIQLESFVDGRGCPDGAVGTYDWVLSEGGTRIHVSPLEEDCQARAVFLTGEWTKSSCDIKIRSCTGVLESGRHKAGVFDPRGGPDDPPIARDGAFTFEVPDGWANITENMSSYELTTAEGYARESEASPLGSDIIGIAAKPVALRGSFDLICAPSWDTTVDRTIEVLANWLTSTPGLVAADPVPITIDGHPGLVIDIDIDVAEVPATPCFDGVPGIPLFANGAAFDQDGWREDPGVFGDNWWTGIAAATTDPVRIILLDLDGDPLLISIDTADPADQAAFIEKAMPIVKSFTFPE